MKKLLSVILALALVLGLSAPTLAAEPALVEFQFQYDWTGELEITREIVYDAAGNKLYQSWFSPDGSDSGRYEWIYDDAGNMLSYIVYGINGTAYRRTEWTYDADGNTLSEIAYYDGLIDESTEYTYDADGNMLSALWLGYENGEEKYGSRTEYTYDAAGKLINETKKSPGLLQILYYNYEYIYDDSGRLLQVIKEDYDYESLVESRLEYTYDNNGNMLSKELYKGDVSDHRYEWTYDANGNMLSKELYKGNVSDHRYEWTYDANGNMLSKELYKGDVSDHRYEWTYDANGNMLSEVVYDGDTNIRTHSYEYTYDNDGRLLSETYNDYFDYTTERTEYDYVAVLPSGELDLPTAEPIELFTHVGGMELTVTGVCFVEPLVLNFVGSGTEPRPTEMLVLHLTEDAVITIRNDSDADGVYGISEDGWMMHDGVIDMGAGGADEYTLGLGETEIIELPAFDPEAPWLSSFYLSPSPETYWFDGTENEYQIYYVKDNGDFSFEPYLANADKAPASGTAYTRTQPVSIDGVAVELEAYALKDPATGFETNYVKLRDVAYALNGTAAQFNVGWDGSVNIITDTAYTPNGTEMSTPFAGDRAYSVPTTGTNINGVAADLDAIVLTDDSGGGYTYYQLRDLGRNLGFNVDWSAERGIFIETDKPYAE